MEKQTNKRCNARRRRRSSSIFQKGHTLFHQCHQKDNSSIEQAVTTPRPILRLPEEIQESVENCPVGSSDNILTQEAPLLLRPSKDQPDRSFPDNEEYRILAPEKIIQLFNKATTDHSSISCLADFEWDTVAEEQWGWCWHMGLTCKKCRYTTGKQKLFYEVPSSAKGRKSATANVGMQVGLSHNMISNTALSQILACANIIPPQYKSMQKQANKVGEALVTLNEQDMQKHRTTTAKIQEYRGRKNEPIPAEGDGRYNNGLFSGGGRTPFQPATQTVYSLAENVTPKKKIIGIYTGNKLCQQAARLRKTGQQITCPDHSGKCTANLNLTDSIGDEARALRSIQRDIAPQLTIGSLTADGDSQAHKALGDNCKIYRDTRHMGLSLKKQIEGAKFSDKVFPGRTKADRQSVHKRFAADLTKRCNAEFKACHKSVKGKLPHLKNRLTYIMDAIINCYSGKCQLCRIHSFACFGHCQRYLLNSETVFNFSDDNDERELRRCLNYRFGSKGTELTALNSNTQKTESLNRTFGKTNPKLCTWPRNFAPRIHSGVHLRNNGLVSSTAAKLEAVGVKLAKRVYGKLQQEDRNMQIRHQHLKSAKHRRRVHEKIANTYRRYDANKLEKTNSTHYKRNMSMPKIKNVCDHNYVKL